VGDLAAGLRWLDQHVNYESAAGGPPRAGSTGGLSLDRMERLVEVLADPQQAYPVIHITGTNGKGSVARMTSALLAELGLSVGTYTSPHLQRINERISRNGEAIPDDDLADLLADLERLVPIAGVEPSYFELLTAAALRWFADVAVDVAVVEVGLLGRYDATNVCDGSVAVITNIGHDHTDFVGDWRARIAEEKAGIVKPGITNTLVLGETDPNLLPIFERAGAERTWYRDFNFGAESNVTAVGGRLLDLRTPSGLYEEIFLSLHGEHQGDNAAAALAATEAFFGAPLDPEVVTQAFGSIAIPGRFEIVRHKPLIVLDGAHNTEGAASAISTLDEDFSVDGDRLIVVGALAPRDPVQLLDALEVDRAAVVIATTAPSPRAVPAEEVAAAAEQLGAPVVVEPDVMRAVDRALAQAGPDDAVLITGSLYVVGQARARFF
jgi:dihydrofolate synthase/folylpolyglutamate synthase